ncbi:MAG: alpha/beta fold hydrolase [Exilibacterium sp.]
MSLVRLSIILFVFLGLCSCTALVSEYLQKSNSFSYDSITSDNQIESLGFKKGKYCSSESKACISYLSGGPINNKCMKYHTELKSGSYDTEVTLNLSRESVPDGISGTIVLIHGFRASKEFMLNSALYFRFLGFNVLVPDLLGHGESEGRKTFGVRDRHIIDELITSEHSPEKNLFVLGNSMGAVTAAYLSTMRVDIKGVILQAPMLRFDEAVLRYTTTNYPYLKYIFNDKDILLGATAALSKENLTVQDTDIKPILASENVPVLLFASSQDLVAPYKSFADLNSDMVLVKELLNRNHPSMGVVDNKDSKIIIDWLKELMQ